MQLATILVEPRIGNNVPQKGKGKEEKERARVLLHSERQTPQGQRAGRPEPTVKAQGEFGTN